MANPVFVGAVRRYVRAADGFARASFTPDGTTTRIEFPYERLRWKCDLRHKVHEFLHADGGALEVQGRKVYGVMFDALFYDGFRKDYPKLYPEGLKALVHAFERGQSGKLVVPTPIIGSIQARCINWEGTFTSKILSGEAVSLGFIEDRTDAFLVEALTSSADYVAIVDINDQLQLEAQAIVPTPSLFDQINSAVNAVLRVRDQADLLGTLLESRLQYVADLCDQADNIIEMRSPAYARVIDALHTVWAAAQNGIKDVQGTRAPVQYFITPRTMSAAEVAGDKHVFNDAARVNDILQVNAVISDPFRIPAGTRLQFYGLNNGPPRLT